MIKDRDVLFKRWIEALREPDRKQGMVYLEQRSKTGAKQQCCLGVLCEVAEIKDISQYLDGDMAIIKYQDKDTVLPPSVCGVMQMSNTGRFKTPVIIAGNRYTSLSALNDSGNIYFPQIADIIDQQYNENGFSLEEFWFDEEEQDEN